MIHSLQEYVYAKRVCACAYTINGQQPVISTYISDEPFYYFEEDDD